MILFRTAVNFQFSNKIFLLDSIFNRDLRNSNQYIVGLALAAIGNIGSIEIARDCAPLVEQLLSSSNPYIRKKVNFNIIKLKYSHCEII